MPTGSSLPTGIRGWEEWGRVILRDVAFPTNTKGIMTGFSDMEKQEKSNKFPDEKTLKALADALTDDGRYLKKQDIEKLAKTTFELNKHLFTEHGRTNKKQS